MVIKRLNELADWATYRKQTVESFRGLTEEAPIFISVDDFDFDIRGSKWPGRVVLCGAKGSSTMAALKKEGLQFRTGTCSVDQAGSTVAVQGMSSSLLKAANKTLDKLSVGCSLELAAERADADGRDDDGEEVPELARRARKTRESLRDRLEAALSGNAPNKATLARLTKAAADAEKKRDYETALATLNELARELVRAEADNDIEAEAEGAEDAAAADAKAVAKLQKKALYKRVQAAIVDRTELRRPIGALVRKADEHEKAGRHDAQLAVYDEIEELLASDEGEDEEADNQIDVRDWGQYRLLVRARLRKLGDSADAQDPFFVSRKKFEFDLGGKPWRGNLVLLGQKSRPLTKRLKREGTTFLEGTCHLQNGEKVIVVGNLAAAARKAAAKTLKLLRLGYRIDGESADEQTGSDVAQSEPAGAAKYERLLRQFAATEQNVRTAFASLYRQMATLDGQADIADALRTRVEALLDHLEGVVATAMEAAESPRTPGRSGARTAVDSAIAEISSDAVLAHVEANPWGISIRGPLLQALAGIRAAMAAA